MSMAVFSATVRVSAWPGLACTCLPLVMSACGGGDAADPGWVVRDSAGIEIVENDHTRPAWGEEGGWRLSGDPVARIGTVAGEESSQQLYRVTDARRLADGRIAVVNSGSREVLLYDDGGRYLGAIGGAGEGPGEFRSPWAVHEIRGDSILVIDLYRHISVFDSVGRYARRFLPDRPSGKAFGEGFEPVDAFGDGSLLFRSHHPQDPTVTGIHRNRIDMVRVGLDGSFVGSLGEFDDQTNSSGGQVFYLFGAWAKEAAADSTMWYGPGDRFELREVGFDGGTLRLVRLDRPPRPVTEADVDAYEDQVREQAAGSRQEPLLERMLANVQYPPDFPAHFELRTDRAGNLWVQDYQPFTARVERVWSVFDPRGRYLGDVVVPAGLAVFDIGEDYVLGRWTDELDVEYVVMYSLEKPSPS